MSRIVDTRVTSAPPASVIPSGLILRVCTNNPFYVISAGLFLVGLRVSRVDIPQDQQSWSLVQAWSLMAALAAYTLLLAGTASLLVRFGNVWDDVRTVLLLVVLMFLATSVTFDEVMFVDPVSGLACSLGGFAFAVAVTEALLRSVRLRLPELFRVPYYLALGLFFFYPPVLSTLHDGAHFEAPREESLQWALYGFATAAGLVALTLLPAVRRGPAYVAQNGSPWRWPLYPWVLFGLLGLAVPARAFLLCVSLDPLTGDDRALNMFGLYFLAPFGMAIAVLLLEMGLTSGLRNVSRAALVVPAAMVLLTLIGNRSDRIYTGFCNLFAARLGCDPLVLTLLAAACFYGYAALRRVPAASEALTAALVALAFVGPHTMDRQLLGGPHTLPFLLAGALQIGIGLWRRDVWRCLGGTAAIAIGGAVALPADNGIGQLRWPLAFHLEVFGLLTLGAVFDDRLGKGLRIAAASLFAAAAVLATFGGFKAPPQVPSWAMATYPAGVAILLTGYGLLVRDKRCFGPAAASGTGWLIGFAWRGFTALRQVVAGLNLIGLSLAFFVVALLISLAKAGALKRWLDPWLAKMEYRKPAPAGVARNVVSAPPAEEDE
jgi:hypothetical protein